MVPIFLAAKRISDFFWWICGTFEALPPSLLIWPEIAARIGVAEMLSAEDVRVTAMNADHPSIPINCRQYEGTKKGRLAPPLNRIFV